MGGFFPCQGSVDLPLQAFDKVIDRVGKVFVVVFEVSKDFPEVEGINVGYFEEGLETDNIFTLCQIEVNPNTADNQRVVETFIAQHFLDYLPPRFSFFLLQNHFLQNPQIKVWN